MKEWNCVIEWTVDAATSQQAAARAWLAIRKSSGPIVTVMPEGDKSAVPAEVDLVDLSQIADDSDHVLLCDACYEKHAGEVAECQDYCFRRLDHEGTCDDPSDVVIECSRCGEADRLTRVDIAEIT